MELTASYPIFASETIDPQNDNFGERLEGIITILVEDIDRGMDEKEVRTHPSVKELERVIFARLGMKVEIITHEALAAILPFYSNTNHIFLHEILRGNLNLRDQNRLIKGFENKKGEVDLKKAKLGGIFSTYEHPLFLNVCALRKECGMTAAEITASLLHELGHGFSACEYSDRADRTNQVLANVARNLQGVDGGDVEYIFKELEKVTPSVKKEEVDKIVHGNRVIAGMTWFRVMVGMVNSQMVNDTYNNTAFEQQADAFTSRFGYGKCLILALEKIHKYSPEKSTALLILAQLSVAAVTIGMILLVMASIASGSFILTFFSFFYANIFFQISRTDMQDHSYDELKVRYLRVRQDIVAQLKNMKAKPAVVKDLLSMLYEADQYIKDTAIVKTLPRYISDFIFSGARAASSSMSDQQLQELLVSNDLFVQSADLRTAS